ncbi:MAG: hypothetical protein RJB39_610 [Candidatus Parcubacteria bacterium]|jgi:hypothetical protein
MALDLDKIREQLAAARLRGEVKGGTDSTPLPPPKKGRPLKSPQKKPKPAKPPRPQQHQLTTVAGLKPIRKPELHPRYKDWDALIAAYPFQPGDKKFTEPLIQEIKRMSPLGFALFQRFMSHQRCMNPVLVWRKERTRRIISTLENPVDRVQFAEGMESYLRAESLSLEDPRVTQRFWDCLRRKLFVPPQ